MVAVLRAHDAVDLTGVVMAFWSGASLLGGVVYGAARREVSPAALLLWLSLLCLPVGLAVGPWSLALLILPTGALCAPLVSATAEAVSRLVPDGAGAEAMGWHGSAMTVGSALGAPLAGAMIDGVGPGGGFAVAGCLGAVLAVVVLMTSRRVAATSHGGPAERAELRPMPSDEDRDREPARA
jgi:predicted MFS family arabinose efflux permease